jgi:glycosyltransferase involved in cell wall biosynthesis
MQMRIALIAPPFIPVPPPAYGGTELYIAHLAEALVARGHDVTVFANGESTVRCRIRAIYGQKQWPLPPGDSGTLKNVDHSVWAMHEGGTDPYDLVHVNDALAVPLSRFLSKPVVHTLHHPHENALSELYARYPAVQYVAISDAQRSLESMPLLTTIRHGIRLQDYQMIERKQPYLAFLGRMAPVKGPHLAIAAARRAGIPLKLAGEIQPVFQSYWDSMVAPHIDGRNVEFVGEASHDVKNELLGNASALLFPIQWHEPFGLVMIEAMACGTPVLALPGGAVREVVADGVSGWVCASVADMAQRACDLQISGLSCRSYVEEHFSVEHMAASYEALYQACAGPMPQSAAAELWS